MKKVLLVTGAVVHCLISLLYGQLHPVVELSMY